MGNDAIRDNFPHFNIDFAGGHAGNHITRRGSDWLWAVTAIMVVSAIAFAGLGVMKPREKRIFNYTTAAIAFVASIAYFSMASNLGWAPIQVEWIRGGKEPGHTRQIFYVRYIDWFITTPLILLNLLLTAGTPWATILYVVLMNWIAVICGLVGSLVYSQYKWGYFTFRVVAIFYIGYMLLWEGRISANRLGKDVGRTFLICSAWTVMLWLVFPIAWGVCEGANVIPADSEAVFYGVLDICSMPVLGAMLLWGHREIDPARLGLTSRDFAGVTGGAHTNGAEKSLETNGINGHTNGTTDVTV